jgi:hypothetical protein
MKCSVLSNDSAGNGSFSRGYAGAGYSLIVPEAGDLASIRYSSVIRFGGDESLGRWDTLWLRVRVAGYERGLILVLKAVGLLSVERQQQQ